MANAVEIVINAADNASAKFKNISKDLSGISNEIKASVNPAFSTMEKQITLAVENAKVKFEELQDTVENKVIPSFVEIGTVGIATFTGLGAVINGVGQMVRDLDTILQSSLGVTLQQFLTQQIEEIYEELTDPFEATATEIVGSVTAIAQSGMTALQSTLSPGLNAVVGKVGSVFSTIPGKVPAWLGGVTSKIVDVFDEAFVTISKRVQETTDGIIAASDAASNVLGAFSGLNEFNEVFGTLKEKAGEVFSAMSGVLQEIYFFQEGLNALQGLVSSGPYQLLIQQNVELQQQLLQTQSSLVATNKILRNGFEIKDPTAAITALNAPVQSAIATIRQGSLEISGTTSKAIIGLFNIISTQASQANLDLKQSAQLALDFSAALGTIGMDASMAQQEISSILTGQIDSNSTLGKTLGLQNEQIKQLVQQGKLYDFLSDKLKAFRAGNAIASQTIEGVTSNIQEQIELIGLAAGKGLLNPIVDELNKVYSYVQENFRGIQEFTTVIATSLLNSFKNISSAIGTLFQSLGGVSSNAILYIFTFLESGTEAFKNALESTIPVIQPFLNILSALIGLGVEWSKTLASLPIFQWAIQFKILSAATGMLRGSFNVFLDILPRVGDGLFLLKLRANASSGALANLSKVFQALGLTQNAASLGSAVLLLGKNMQSIPGAAALVQKQIAGMLGPFSALAGSITALIPTLSGAGIAFASIVSKSPGLQSAIAKIASDVPTVAKSFAAFLDTKGFGDLGKEVLGLSSQFEKLTDSTNLSNAIQEKFNDIVKQSKSAIIKQAAVIGVWAIGLAAAATLFNEMLQRQKDGGKPIYDLAKRIESSTATIRSVWDKTRKTTKDNLIANEDIPPTDWIDTWIIKMRQLESGTMQIKTFWDGVWAIVAGIGEGINYVIVKPIQTLGTSAGIVFGTLTNAFDSLSILMKNPFDPKNIQEAFNRLKDGSVEVGKEGSEAIKKTWTSSMKDVETKSEETFREISEAISSGKIQEAVGENVKAINDLVSSGKDAGNLFGEALDPVKSAINGLKDGTKNIDDVKAAIASLPDTIPENRKKDLVNLLEKEFPNGVANSGKSAKEMEASLSALNNALDLTNADASNIMMQELRENTDDQIASLDEQINALKKSGRGNSEAARTLRSLKAQLEASRDAMNSFTESVKISPDPVKQLVNQLSQFDEELKKIENRQGSSEKANAARLSELQSKGVYSAKKADQEKLDFSKRSSQAIYQETLKRYEQAQTAYNKLTDEEKTRATEAKEKLIELEGKLADARIKTNETAMQQEEAKNKDLVEDYDETQKKIDAAKASGKINEKEYNKQSLANNLAKNKEELRQAQEQLSKLDDTDKEGREALNARIAELASEKEKILADSAQKEIDLIERAQQKALDAVQLAETDRLSDLQKLRNAGAISEAEFSEKSVNITKEKIQAELKAERIKLAQIEALPKPNDPEEAGKRESEIRQSRLKTKTLTLDLLKNEKEAYDAHLNTIVEAIKRQSTQEAIARQKAINAGTMSREDAALKEAQSTARGLQKQIAATTKDKDKKLDLEKQYQEALEKIREAKITARLAQINKESLKEQIAIQNKVNAGKATEEQASLARVKSEIKSADAELKLRQKGTKEYLEVQKKRSELTKQLQDAEVAAKLAAINKQSTIEQIAVLKQVATGKAIAETAARIKVQSELKAAEAELKIRKKGTKEYLAAEQRKWELVKQLQDAKVAERLAQINKESLKEQVAIAKRIANGTATEEQANVARVQSEIKANNAELKERAKGTKEYLEAEKKKYELIKQLRDAKLAQKIADINKESLIEQIGIAKRISEGTATEEQANTAKIQAETKANDATLAAQKKGTTPYLEAERKKYELIKQLRDAKVAEKLASINQEQLQEQILLQKRLNKGEIEDVDANVVRQKQAIARIKAELALETTNKTKILELRKSLAEAEGALQDAIVAKKKADLERQNQALQNTITKQNQALEKQLSLHDSISKALDNRAKLLDATKDFTQAIADGMTNELDVMASLETSEYKKRQLAETGAAIKIRALQKQLEFEKESLLMQQEQNALALEREKIQARINAAQARADTAKAVADLAMAEADPKTTKEQRDALRLQVDANRMKEGAFADQMRSLDQQGLIQERINQMQLQSFDVRSQGQMDRAKADYINTLTPGLKQRASRMYQDEIAQRGGYSNYRQFRESGVAMSRQELLQQMFPGIQNKGVGNFTLEAFDPGLGDLREVLSSQRFRNAVDDTQGKFDTKYGDFGYNLPNPFGNYSGKAMQLPKELTASLALPVGKQKLEMPGLTKLNPSVDKFTEAANSLSKVSAGGVQRTYNITVNVPGSSTQTVTKKEILAGIERAIKEAERTIA